MVAEHGEKAIQTLSKIVTYALIANVFFLICEVFVAMYSNIPEHMDHLAYLFFGLHGHSVMAPWMWMSMIFLFIAIILLVNPATRSNNTMLGIEYLWGAPVQLETSEVVSVSLPPDGSPGSGSKPAGKEGPQDEQVQWQRVVYTMKDRKLSRKIID